MGRSLDVEIPNTIDEVLSGWDAESPSDDDGSENYRLTLFYKDNQRLYGFLSGNMQEIRPGEKIDFGVSLSLAGKPGMGVHYDVVFHEREIDGGRYLVMEQDGLDERERKVLPFCFEGDLPSVIVDKKVRKDLEGQMDFYAQQVLDTVEYIGERGFLRALLEMKFLERFKKQRKESREMRMALKKEISDLLEGEESPSSFIQPSDYHPEDRKIDSMFVKKRYFSRAVGEILLNLPFIAAAPHNHLTGKFRNDLRKGYEARFKQNQSPKDAERSALSEFAVAHPRVVEGAERMLETVKHFANYTMFGALGGFTYWRASGEGELPLLSYPWIAWTAASGVTMLGNLICSKGRNSSGLISTIIDRWMGFNNLE